MPPTCARFPRRSRASGLPRCWIQTAPSTTLGSTLEILVLIDPRLFEIALRWLVAESDGLHLRFVETDGNPLAGHRS